MNLPPPTERQAEDAANGPPQKRPPRHQPLSPWLTALGLCALGIGLSFALQALNQRLGAAARPAAENQPAAIHPQRIISLGPNITETLFALGAGDRIAGAGEFCNFPEAARRLPRLGGLLDPNIEQILALKPDLLILQSRNEKLLALCELTGIPFLLLEMNDLQSIDAGIEQIGRITGLPGEAAILRAQIQREQAELRRRLSGRIPRRVFICLSRMPGSLAGLMTAGKGSFLDQILTLAGGLNIFGDAPLPYPQTSKEALLKRDPEIIIEVQPDQALDPKRLQLLKADWASAPGLSAVQSGRIFFQREDYLLIPGPRIIEAARLLARRIHPEAFDD